MTTEMQMLVWSLALGLAQLIVAALGMLGQRGPAWAASARDGTPTPLTGIVARLDRGSANFLETFVFFAVLVLVGHVLQRHSSMTVFGAQLYFWARLIYVPLYAFGIAYLRTLVWSASMAGIVLLLIPLF